MLSGNYITFELKSKQSGGSPFCQICESKTEPETLEHLIAKCEGVSDIRMRIMNSMTKICQDAGLKIDLSLFSSQQLTQFILDPSSNNLKERDSISHTILSRLFHLSRDYCFDIDRMRTKSLI